MKPTPEKREDHFTFTVHKRSVWVGIGIALLFMGDKAPEFLMRILAKLIP